MKIFPAIDLFQGKAVRLYQGDYQQMTIYSEDPPALAVELEAQGAECLHLVDLEGAKSGGTENAEVIRRIKAGTGLFTELGGGIRSMDVVERYLSCGIDRVIIGTAAVTDERFLKEALARYGEKIAVGVDIRDGQVAIHGWTESSGQEAFGFCQRMQELGVRTLIVTDIHKDGAMAGANHDLYRELKRRFTMDIIASGGVSSLSDVEKLRACGADGAIIGKAWYTGKLSVKDAVEVSR